MTSAQEADPTKANGPGATEPNADARTDTRSLPHWLRPVNALSRYPADDSTRLEWDAYWALDVSTREAIEFGHRQRTCRNRHAVDCVYKHSLKLRMMRNRSGVPIATYVPLGVAAVGHRLGLLPFELVAVNQPGKAYWRTIGGTPVGTRKGRGLTLSQRQTHLLDVEGIDKRFLFDGCFLVKDPDGWERMLDPRNISARDEYAARLYLCMRGLGANRPEGGNVKAAIRRLRAQVEGVQE